jgi:hypothetical protein
MTVPNPAVRPPHTFRLEPWSSGAAPVAGEGAGADAPGVTQEAPRVMGFHHDLDAMTYDLRRRVLGAGLLKQPVSLVGVATWLRARTRQFRQFIASLIHRPPGIR